MKQEFGKDTGYKIDKTNPNVTTYWHLYEQVGEAEYYRHYSEWIESNCAILTKQQSEHIYFHLPIHIKENEGDMPAIIIKSILKL